MPATRLSATSLAPTLIAWLLASTALPTLALPIGYTAWDVGGNDKLLRIDLATGAGTVIGSNLGFSDVDGLAFDAAGQLWAVDDNTNRLLSINTSTGVATGVGSGFGSGFNDMGLAFGADGTLYMAAANTGGSVGSLYSVDTANGLATAIGTFSGGLKVRSLGQYGGVLYGWSSVDTLVSINTGTGAVSTIGAFGFSPLVVGHDGMDADPATGMLWSIAEVESRTYTLNPLTGAATLQAGSLSCNGGSCSAGGFNGLAISAVPEPSRWALTALGLLAVAAAARRRRS